MGIQIERIGQIWETKLQFQYDKDMVWITSNQDPLSKSQSEF